MDIARGLGKEFGPSMDARMHRLVGFARVRLTPTRYRVLASGP